MATTSRGDAKQSFALVGHATSRADLVVESVKAAILGGAVKAGDILVERRIAEELGVSKTPVREALITLARSGLLEISRNRGTTVRSLSLTDVRHIYEERLLLEPWAVAQATSSGASFGEAASALESAHIIHATADDKVSLALANRRFHRGLYLGCENTLVTGVLDSLQDLTALATTGTLWENWATWEPEKAEHEEVLAAAQRGDHRAAERLLRLHICAGVDRVKDRESKLINESGA